MCYKAIRNSLIPHKSETLEFLIAKGFLKPFPAFIYFWHLKQTRADNAPAERFPLFKQCGWAKQRPGPVPSTHTGNRKSLLTFTFPEQDFMGSSECVCVSILFQNREIIEGADSPRKEKSSSCPAEVTTNFNWPELETPAGKKKIYLVHFHYPA